MVMHYPSPAEVRRGGWLTRAEGRVKTKGLPVGPRQGVVHARLQIAPMG